jgi:hypothetical protein
MQEHKTSNECTIIKYRSDRLEVWSWYEVKVQKPRIYIPFVVTCNAILRPPKLIEYSSLLGAPPQYTFGKRLQLELLYK